MKHNLPQPTTNTVAKIIPITKHTVNEEWIGVDEAAKLFGKNGITPESLMNRVYAGKLRAGTYYKSTSGRWYFHRPSLIKPDETMFIVNPAVA